MNELIIRIKITLIIGVIGILVKQLDQVNRHTYHQHYINRVTKQIILFNILHIVMIFYYESVAKHDKEQLNKGKNEPHYRPRKHE